MGKSTISMAMFNSYVSLPEGKSYENPMFPVQFSLSANPNPTKMISAKKSPRAHGPHFHHGIFNSVVSIQVYSKLPIHT